MKIQIANLKPVRCKGKSCTTRIIGFASEDSIYVRWRSVGQEISISGEELILGGGDRRSHARSVRALAAQRQNQLVEFVIDDPPFEDPRLRTFEYLSLFSDDRKGYVYVFGYVKRTNGKGISITCEGCGSTRKIRGMNSLISTELVEILLDNLDFNLL